MPAKEQVLSPAELEAYHELQRSFWWFVGRRTIVRDLVWALRGPHRPRILEVGCGTGLTLHDLSKAGFAVGVDTSEDALRLCRRESAAPAVLADGEALPVANRSVDAVLALDVLEHLEDDGRLLSEIDRVLRPGGWVLITVPAFSFLWSWTDEQSGHHRRYTAPELASRLGRVGFTVERLSYFNALLFPALVVERVIRRFTAPSGDAYFRRLPRPVERFLTRVFETESVLMRTVDLPFGGSVLAVGRKVAQWPAADSDEGIA